MIHGTTSSYAAGCHCLACRQAARDYERFYSAGGRLQVSPDAAITHVRWLLSQGMTQAGIARAAGISTSALSQLLLGQRRRIHVRRRDALLGITLGPAAEGSHVPASEVAPLIDAMLAAGFEGQDLCRMLGLKRKGVPYRAGYRRVHWRTYRRVLVLYRLLVRAGRVPVLLDIEEAS